MIAARVRGVHADALADAAVRAFAEDDQDLCRGLDLWRRVCEAPATLWPEAPSVQALQRVLTPARLFTRLVRHWNGDHAPFMDICVLGDPSALQMLLGYARMLAAVDTAGLDPGPCAPPNPARPRDLSSTHRPACDRGRAADVALTASTLARLRTALERGHRDGVLPYNPTALIRRLAAAEAALVLTKST